MNKRAKVVLGTILCVALGCAVLAGCGSATAETTKAATTTAAQTASGVLNFVAADKTNWDKEITIGEKTYTLAINFADGGAATLTATEVGGTDTIVYDGSYVYETGYGYTVTINGYTTKTSFDDASSRQVMYIEVPGAGLVQFQAKDTAFRKEKAADYQDYEVRDAAYIFEEVTKSSGNNSSTHLYLEEDGVANSLVYSGSSGTYKRGTWTTADNNNLVVTIDGSDYSVLYCDIAGKEGYRVVYNSKTMYTNDAVEYTDADFEGAITDTFYCAEQDYTLSLTEKGYANLYQNGEKAEAGSFTKSGDVLTVIIAGNEYVSADGMINISFEKAENSSNTTVVDRTFALDGSVPEGAPAEGAPAEGAPAEGAPAEGAPAEGAPAEGAPAEGAPAEGAPAEGAPAEGAPAGGSNG